MVWRVKAICRRKHKTGPVECTDHVLSLYALRSLVRNMQDTADEDVA